MSLSADTFDRFADRAPRRQRRRARGAPTLDPRLWERPLPLADLRPQSAEASLHGKRWLPVVMVAAAHLAVAWLLVQPAPPMIEEPPVPEVVLELARPAPPAPAPPVERPPKPQPQSQPQPRVEQAPTPLPKPEPVQQAVSPPQAEPLAPAPPAPAKPAPPVERVTEPLGHAGYLNNPAPVYPPLALRRGWEGQVLLRVRVLASGRPASVELQQSSGFPPLDEAAIRTVKQWLFRPAKRGATPIDGWATVPIDFRLSK